MYVAQVGSLWSVCNVLSAFYNLCVPIYIYICVYLNEQGRISLNVFKGMHVSIYPCAYVSMNLCMHVCISAAMYVCYVMQCNAM